MLGNIEALPTKEEINTFVRDNVAVRGVISSDDEEQVHKKAKDYLEKEDVISAWKVLLAERI